MKDKVLIVDDEPNVLAACERHLRKTFFIETALGGESGVKAVMEKGPFAVIVSDMQMPEMDGIEFLSEIRKRAPDTVRMVLTGNAGQQSAVDAINEGHIFRFLNKPCLPRTLRRAIEAGVKQYRLVTAERELLEKTLSASIQVLIEILSIVAPLSFRSAQKTEGHMRSMAISFGITDVWELDVASMLSQIGIVTLPTSVIEKSRAEEILSRDEQDMLDRIPEIGRDLVRNIPRLGSVAQTIYYQNKRFDGSGFPRDSVHGEDIPIGARLLKLCMDLTRLELSGKTTQEAFELMSARRGWYDSRLFKGACKLFASAPSSEKRAPRSKMTVSVKDLRIGQVLASPVETADGKVLLQAGRKISSILLARIRNFEKIAKIKEPVHVVVLSPERVAGTVGR